MTQYQDPIGNFEQAPAQPGKQSNVTGLVGFILSLVSLITCGCLAPISLIVSVIALFKAPRGFAIAGTVISLILLVLAIVGISIFVSAAQQAGGVVQQAIVLGVADQSIRDFYNANGRMPDKAELENAVNIEMSNVPTWMGGGPVNFAYDYTYSLYSAPDDYEFELVMPGEDGQLGTSDDIRQQGFVP